MHSAPTRGTTTKSRRSRRLSRAEAADPGDSPAGHFPVARGRYRVLVGLVIVALVLLATGDLLLMASALYGAAVVAVPGALMARGATSRLGTISPLTSTVNIMGWAMVKIVVSGRHAGPGGSASSPACTGR